LVASGFLTCDEHDVAEAVGVKLRHCSEVCGEDTVTGLCFAMRIYGYVVMPEHIHLLVSEPQQAVLADAIHFLKLSFSKRVPRANWAGAFWQKRYYDRNVRDQRESEQKLRYLHRNPVKRGDCAPSRKTGSGAASGIMHFAKRGWWRSSQNGRRVRGKSRRRAVPGGYS
jgi:REP element-mobilizing transposase RayT